MLVERATAADAPAAARLAALKRTEYERYSPVFWRPSADARERHEPFLRFCLDSPEFTSYAARDDGELRGIAIAHHRVAPPPLTSENMTDAPATAFAYWSFTMTAGALGSAVPTAAV